MKLKPKSKKPDSAPKLELEEVIGLTTRNGNGLAANVLTGDCIYLAGCVVVVYNIHTATQSHLSLSSRLPKPLTCLALSIPFPPHAAGYYIAAGESGHQPAVLIWEYSISTRTLLAELKGHRYGVACIGFSPDGKHLASVGCSQDGYICVWDWRSGRLATKLKASTAACSSISAIHFSSDGSFFVTAGKQHLNIWTVSTKSRSKTGIGLLTIDGKPANVGCHKGSSFISVASAADNMPSIVSRGRTVAPYPIYALTDAGVLCLLHSGFSVRRWVDLKVDKGFALSVSNKLIACACSSGIVQLFTVENIKYVGSLLYSETNDPNLTSVPSRHGNTEKSTQGAAACPDAIACQFTTSEKLVVVYGDHSLYVWDVHEIPKVSRSCILVSHSGCIWDVKNLPCRNMHDPALACVSRGSCLGVSFATCSADGTIRLWDFELKSDTEKDSKLETALNKHFNTSLKTEQVGTIHLVSYGTNDRVTAEAGVRAQGFRSMAVSSDGNYLAAGDCHGNLHLYNLCTFDYTCFQEVHDAEILSLSFSAPNMTITSTRHEQGPHYLLASGGRDHTIHVYDINRSFDLIGSLDDHSAAVTSVKLTCNGCSILSCSADRSVLFRDVDITDAGFTTLRHYRQTASHGILYDMAIDPLMEAAITVGQDKKINIFNIISGKLVKTFKQDPDFGEPIKVTIDPSGSFVVCSYSNRSLSIHDFASGKILSQATGHAEVITGVIFLPDCERIISVGGDSCIFVWRLPALLSATMFQKIIERVASPSQICSSQLVVPNEGSILHEEICHQSTTKIKGISELGYSSQAGEQVPDEEGVYKESSAFKFSISRLPKWAQNQVAGEEIAHVYPESNVSLKEFPLPVAGNCEPSSTTDPIGIHTPCHPNSGRTTISHTRASESPSSSVSDGNSQEIPCNINMEKRWNTIHTVCLDLFDSPEVRDLKDIKVPVLVPNLKDQSLEEPGGGEGSEIILDTFTAGSSPQMLPICGQSIEEVNGGKWSAVSEQVNFNVGNLFEDEDQSHVQSAESNCDVVFDKDSSEQLVVEGSQICMQTTEGVENNDSQHQVDSLFSQHFSNLSTSLKVKGRKSSARRSFSARFFVCRDQLTGCKRLFETSTENLGTEDFNCDKAGHLSLAQDLTDNLSTDQPSDSCHQDEEKPNGSSATPRQSDSTNSTQVFCLMNGNIEGGGDQRQGILEGNELQERITECRAALLALDTAAEKALRLFVELGIPVAQEDASGGLGAEFSDLTSNLLPSIMNRVQALADLVQISKTSYTSDTAAEASEFEPRIERFVDSFSSKVLELVKKNI